VVSEPSEHGAPGHRHARLEHILQEELVTLLRDEIINEHVEDVRVSSVALSADYHNARVHYSLQTDELPTRVQLARADAALAASAGFLRARLAESLDLKRVPNLRFILAQGTESGEEDEDAWWR
jgi:ribosome-binding factor A